MYCSAVREERRKLSIVQRGAGGSLLFPERMALENRRKLETSEKRTGEWKLNLGQFKLCVRKENLREQ